MGIKKYKVKYSHCLKPEMMFAELSFVYLNPWVILLSLLSLSMAESIKITDEFSQ